MHILKDMAHVRISGTKEEADCAIYLQECCKKMGFETRLEAFQVEMCDIHEAVLTVDGKEIPCKGYQMCIRDSQKILHHFFIWHYWSKKHYSSF